MGMEKQKRIDVRKVNTKILRYFVASVFIGAIVFIISEKKLTVEEMSVIVLSSSFINSILDTLCF